MICNICGEEQEKGRIVEIVTGNMLSNSTKTDEMTYSPVTTQTFGQFQKIEFWFCQECWRSRRRGTVDKNLKIAASITGIGVIVSILGFVFHGGTIAGLGFLGALLGLIVLIVNSLKKWKTDYSKLDMLLEKSEDLFLEFNDLIPVLVYKAKGKTYYWPGESWQAAMDKKPHSNNKTYESQGPEA